MPITPYAFFHGRAEEAIAFYTRTLGAEATVVMRNRDAPEPMPGAPPEAIMHAELQLAGGTLMLSDGSGEGHGFHGISLALSATDAPEAGRLFAALADGGRVVTPLSPTFWSAAFGMVHDRFGVEWLVMAPPA